VLPRQVVEIITVLHSILLFVLSSLPETIEEDSMHVRVYILRAHFGNTLLWCL
jgi:hypothetical protein